MTFATIRAEVKTVLDTVAGIGKTHDFLRHAVFWDDYFTKYKDTDKINAWEISRLSQEEEIESVQNLSGSSPTFRDTHVIIIRGYRSLDDSVTKEKTFLALIDSIIAAFRATDDIQLLNGKLIVPLMISVPVIEHRLFGSVLVHFAEIQIVASERVGG